MKVQKSDELLEKEFGPAKIVAPSSGKVPRIGRKNWSQAQVREFEIYEKKIVRRTGSVKRRYLKQLFAKKILRVLLNKKRYAVLAAWAERERKRRGWTMSMLRDYASGVFKHGGIGNNKRGRISKIEMIERQSIREEMREFS